jgi:hypothetical protein
MSRQDLLPKCLAAVAAGLVMAVLLNGCASGDSKRREIAREHERLFWAYIDDDVNEARRSLEQTLDLLQSPKAQVLGRNGRAHRLFLTYARL